MTFEKLAKIISEQFEISPEEITMDTTIDDLGADSLDLIDLVMSIEDEFTVEVPETAMDELNSVGDMVNFIDGNK